MIDLLCLTPPYLVAADKEDPGFLFRAFLSNGLARANLGINRIELRRVLFSWLPFRTRLVARTRTTRLH